MKKTLMVAVFALTSSLSYASPAIMDTKQACAKPEYPKTSLMNEEQGTVTVALLVGTDGAVSDSKIEKSSGSRNLDKAAQKSLAACKFKPANGKAEWQTIDYAWKLD